MIYGLEGKVDFYLCDDCGHYYMNDGVNCDCIASRKARPLRLVQMVPIESEVPLEVSNMTMVDRGALQMAVNVLRRSGKDEVADALIGGCKN